MRSSRRLEAETHRNIEVIWLLRHLKPWPLWRVMD
jgi:transposase